jgi:formylglycine-generating enzyme required for sulfatase activity
MEARFIEQVGSNVRIKNEAGREFTLPITRFSKEDQEYVVEAAARALFQTPEPFEDRGKGAIIIASATGKVTVIPAPRYSGSQEVIPVARDVIVGEPLPHGSTIITGANSEVDLLLTTGSLAKVGPNSKLVLNAFWQKDFAASPKKVTDLKEETSPSRVSIKLETGDLVVDVKKLNRESSFIIESPVGVAGIRGTQFGLSADSDSAELAVLEGRVGFLDTNQKAKSVETAQKVAGSEDGAGELNTLPESEKAQLAMAVADSQESASEYDLTRLANTVEGFAPKPNYIVKSALNMELIWCPPGSFIMGPTWTMGGRDGGFAHPVTLTEGFYLGKYEVTQEEYQKVMDVNPSEFKGEKLPVETVSWNDAMAFCEALTKKQSVPNGWKFTLPTEAQWEYACRAGTITNFSWGDDVTPKLANYGESELEKTSPVGAYPSHPWGFHDIHGNLGEWCRDWLGPYPNKAVIDPLGSDAGTRKVTRGGSWRKGTDARGLYSTTSGGVVSTRKVNYIGFRISLQKSR